MAEAPPDLTPALRAGRRALEGRPGVRLVEDFVWFGKLERWWLQIELEVDARSSPWVGERTLWSVLVDPLYPRGAIEFFPAKEGGLTATFPHQARNDEGSADRSWRTGKLCLWPDIAVLGRSIGSKEPRGADRRLAWHADRARRWLELAVKDELLPRGDYFELPDYAGDPRFLLAFDETPETLGTGTLGGEALGFFEARVLSGRRTIYLPSLFGNVHGEILRRIEWGRYISTRATISLRGLWLLLPDAPRLEPWQGPRTWGDLRNACQAQGLELDDRLTEFGRARRRLRKRKRDDPESLLLIGFPLSDKVGGPPRRLHWLALRIPTPAAGTTYRAGFRPDGKGYRLQDEWHRSPRKALRWLPSESWAPEERTARGRLAQTLRDRSVLLVGAGSLGSAVAELLVRGGVDRMTVLDSDLLQAGNLVRHTLGLPDLGRNKAQALADRLNQLSPSASVRGLSEGFDARTRLPAEYDLVLDTTGDDDVLFALETRAWKPTAMLASLWMGFGARKAYAYVASGGTFKARSCLEAFELWRQRQEEENEGIEPPRLGIGCWHPVFPARADDVWLMASLLVRHLAALPTESAGPALAVYGWENDGGTGDRLGRIA